MLKPFSGDPAAPDRFESGLKRHVSSATTKRALEIAFEQRRERLNEAVQKLDDTLGDCDPAVIEAVEAFLQVMWKEY